MKKVVSLLLALVFVFGCFALGESDLDTQIIYAHVVSEDGEQSILYELPGEYRPEVCEVKNGSYLQVQFEGSSWYKVKVVTGGKVGWMKASEVKITTRGYSALTCGCSVRAARMVKSSDGEAVLRWGPDTKYDIIDTLYNGTVVWFYETCGDWSRVLLEDGRVGYVYTKLLTKTDLPEEWNDTIMGFVQVTGNSAVVKKQPKSSSATLTTYKSGTIVEIYGEYSSYMMVYDETKQAFGYIHTDIVSPAGLNKTLTKCDLYYDNPNVYECDVIWQIPAKTTLKILANDGQCSRVQYDTDVIGYVLNQDLVF